MPTRQELSQLLSLYESNPLAFTDDNVDELERLSSEAGFRFQRNMDAEESKIGGVINQALSGFAEGFTLFGWADEPRTMAEKLANRIGHLAGFAPSILAGPLGLGAKVAGKVGLKVAKRGLTSGANIAQQVGKYSIPMLAGEKAVKGLGAVSKGNAVIDSIKFLREGSASRSILRSAIHLGAASTASGARDILAAPTFGEGVDRLVSTGVSGAAFGAVFGTLGNYVKLGKMMKSSNKATVARAETLLKGVAGSLFQGLPATLQNQPLEMQVYDYLLGAYFGGKSKDVHFENALKFAGPLQQKGKGLDLMKLQLPEGHKNLDKETQVAWNRLSDKSKGIVKENSEKYFGKIKEAYIGKTKVQGTEASFLLATALNRLTPEKQMEFLDAEIQKTRDIALKSDEILEKAEKGPLTAEVEKVPSSVKEKSTLGTTKQKKSRQQAIRPLKKDSGAQAEVKPEAPLKKETSLYPLVIIPKDIQKKIDVIRAKIDKLRSKDGSVPKEKLGQFRKYSKEIQELEDVFQEIETTSAYEARLKSFTKEDLIAGFDKMAAITTTDGDRMVSMVHDIAGAKAARQLRKMLKDGGVYINSRDPGLKSKVRQFLLKLEPKQPKPVEEAPEKPPEVKPEAPPPEPGKVARPSEEKTGLQKLEKKVDKPATGLDKLKKEPQGKNTYRIMLKDKSWPGDTAADSPKEVLEKLNIDPDQVEVFKVKTDSRGGGWAKVKPEEYIDKLVSGGEAEVSAEPSEGTFVVNRETKKLELHFSKEDYQALDPEVKKMIKSYFLFSRNKSAWISKASRHLSYPKTIAAKAGLTDGGKIGEKISFAERMEREAERAEVKAERAGETAMKRKREGEQLQGEFNELRKDWAFITQPIMSGHAGSEAFGRQRSRIMARYDKGFEKYSQSEYYQKKAERLRRAAKQTKLKDPVYLSRRIKENRRIIANIKKNIPDYEERLAKAETDADKAKYQGWLEEVMDNLADRIDKLTFFTEAMENIGGLKYTKEKLKGATHVVYRKYGWYPVIRLNPKTVTIGNWLDVETSTWKAPYAEITDAKFKEQEVAKPKGLEKLEKPAAGKSLADHGLQVQKLISKKGRPYWIVTGNTKPNKDLLKSLGARYNKYKRGWSFFNGDPTNIINDAFEAVAKGEPITTPDTEKSGARERDHAEVARLKGIRTREDERPDERRTSSDLGSYVSKQTHDLIYKGRDYGIPDDVLSEQVDDVAFINQAYQNGKQMFVLANEAGTGKTFVLGGAIRELKASGAQRIVYVTMNNNLIKQIKNDLQEYGIPGVEFFTYSKIRSTPIGATDVVIFDESQNIKNLDSKQGKSAQLIIGDTKFTIFSSATPFENPVEAKYFEKSGVFQKAGGFLDWAKAYGAQTIKKKYFDYAAGVQVIEEKPIWRGGKVEDGQAARKWFFKQGIMTQRNMRIPVDMVDTGFQKVEVDKYWADVYEKVTAGFEAAMNRYEGPDGKPTDPIMYMQLAAYKTNLQKRILESAKVQTGIARAKDHLADGRNVVIFVETKAQRRIYNTEPYDEMVARYVNWKAQRQAGITADGEKPPYSKVQLEVARIINEGEFDFDLGSTTETISKAFGSDKVAIYTGEVTDAAANRNLDSWRMKKKPVLVATMAKGGTGLSLHDTGGDRPTSQVNINLPWKATGVDQVSGRTARYGLRSKANIEWIFANNIPFDVMLSGRVGQRMADMGAIVKGLDLESAKLLQDFDFEGRVNIQRQDKTVLYSKEELQAQDSTEDIYKRAARLEDTRLKAQYTEGDFFETPYPVSVLVSRIANIQPGDNILEPSAGRGSLLKFLPEGVTINAIEQRNDNWEYLKEHFELAGISGRGDFLEKAEGFRFDAVIMNPPFGRLKGVGWQDATHVLKAYDNLMPGGRLVAIMGEGSFFRSDNQSTEFRDWLEDVGATVVTLPENTFKKSGTGVRTRLVVIDKNSDTGRTDYELDNIEDIQRVEDFFILERDNQQKKVNYGASPGFIDFSSVHSQFLKKIASENEKFEKLFLQQEYKSGNPIDWLKSVKERYTGKLELQPPEIHVKKADLPEDSPMSANAIKDSFRHIKDVTRFAREEAVRTIEDIVAPLKNAEDMALFERLIITRDLIATAKEGMAVPYELTEEELVKELARLMEISSDNVLQTVENHFLKMQEQGLDLVERGKIEKPRDDYFPHKVIEYYQNFNRISGTGPRFKGPYRPYTRMREGSDKPIKTDYINTMIGHLTKLYSDNMVDDFQAEILNKLDITGRLVEEVRKEEPELTYQEALKEIQIPDGYTKYQPNPGNFYYTGSKVTDSVLESATEEFFNSLDMMMKSGFPIPPRVFDLLNAREALMVGHKRPTFILPSTLAKQFTQYRKYEMVHGWEKIIHDLTMAWKWNVLVLNPKYQFKNLMGDSLNLFFDDATAFTKHPEAMLMLIDRSMQRFGLKKLNPVELSTKIQALVDEYGYKAQTYVDLAEELGVIDSGFTGKEIAEIFAMPEFRRFARNILESGKIVMKEIPKGLREISTIRENWARLAKFLKDLDRIEKGKKYLSLDDRVKNVFRKALGLAQITPKSVKTKTTNIEGLDSIGAAAKASREALLDYGAFSKAEDRWLRRALVPFWAWLKGNLKMQTTRATKYPINYFTKLALISTALYLWNHRDEESSEFEEKLPEWAKHMPHINLMIGGSYRNLMIDSPWSDAAETLGLTGALVMLEGGSAAEGFNQGIEDATKKWGSSLNFLAKESLEQGVGRDFFTGYRFLPYKKKGETDEQYAIRALQARKKHALENIRFIAALNRMERMKDQGRPVIEEFLPIRSFPPKKKKTGLQKLKRGI